MKIGDEGGENPANIPTQNANRILYLLCLPSTTQSLISCLVIWIPSSNRAGNNREEI